MILKSGQDRVFFRVFQFPMQERNAPMRKDFVAKTFERLNRRDFVLFAVVAAVDQRINQVRLPAFFELILDKVPGAFPRDRRENFASALSSKSLFSKRIIKPNQIRKSGIAAQIREQRHELPPVQGVSR